MHDFEMAKDKVLMGPERQSMIITEKEKRITAYHEAGHALVGKLLPGSDPVHKVTIIPRGRALGVTQQLPPEDRLNISKEAANDQIAMAMGGRVAEELIFGQMTTGAANDIEVATDLARKMVCEWGMCEKLGPLHFGKSEDEVFLGRDFGDGGKDYSEQTAHRDRRRGAARSSRRTTTARARSVMDNLDKLKLLAEALLEYETIDGAEIDTIFAGRPARPEAVDLGARPRPPPRSRQGQGRRSAPPRSIFAPPRPAARSREGVKRFETPGDAKTPGSGSNTARFR